MTHDFQAERARARAALASGQVKPNQPWAPVAHLYRGTDPEPSRQAAEHVTTIGSRAEHLKRIVAAVRRFPGSTSAELAQIANLDRVEAARRTADAEHQGLITKAAARVCDVTGRRCVTWVPVSADVRDVA